MAATSMEDVVRLTNAMLDAQEAVANKEAELKTAKEHLRILAEESIPGVMQELGVKDLQLDTGKKLSLKQDVYASLTADNKAKAFQWLDDNNFGGLIKVNVVTSFGKGEKEFADALFQRLLGEGMDTSLSQDVHAQTLKAFLREQLAKGADIPLELFNARPVFVAQLKNK